VGAPTHTEQVSAGSVRDGFRRATSAIQKCYRDNLLAVGAANEGHGSLHIQTDDSGHVQRATVTGAVGSRVASCIEGVAMSITIPGVDTGQPTADIPLEFKAR
jgi:hypothetical protein